MYIKGDSGFKFQFKVVTRNLGTLKPKGFYYQGKNIVIVGDVEKKNHSIRQNIPIKEIIFIEITTDEPKS